VFWSYHGLGGACDYWPDGLDGRMYHRIGWTGDPAAIPVVLSAAAQIGEHADGGWIITDTGTSPVRYDDRDIRISILWKAQVRPRS